MSHAIGARCGVPHGTGNGILLPHVMRYNLEAAGPKLALIAHALGCEPKAHESQLAMAAADAVAALLLRLGHPTKLSQVGVSEGDLVSCGGLALSDAATTTNPRAVRSADEVMAVYRLAL
jgi:alcohol dehydrogenase class IV